MDGVGPGIGANPGHEDNNETGHVLGWRRGYARERV